MPNQTHILQVGDVLYTEYCDKKIKIGRVTAKRAFGYKYQFLRGVDPESYARAMGDVPYSDRYWYLATPERDAKHLVRFNAAQKKQHKRTLTHSIKDAFRQYDNPYTIDQLERVMAILTETTE
jgi:hypothetical protein